MDKGKPATKEIASSLRNVHLNPRPKPIAISFPPFDSLAADVELSGIGSEQCEEDKQADKTYDASYGITFSVSRDGDHTVMNFVLDEIRIKFLGHIRKLSLNEDQYISSIVDQRPLSLPSRRNKPRSLVNLCIGFLGQYLEDIIADISEIATELPADIKLALVSIARRRQLLNDDILIALAENSWKILDISGSDVTDFGLKKISEICIDLQAIDISRCDKITVASVAELIHNCHSLEILRCGGSPWSESTARQCVGILMPRLNNVEKESWEELENGDIGSGPQSLRWLVWPKIDEASKANLAAECPRVVVNPQPSPVGFRRVQVPREALASIALDDSIVEGIDPKTWAISSATRRAPLLDPKTWAISSTARRASPSPGAEDKEPELSVAERFRLAFVERDARLAPKRAKNARQHRRREAKEYLMSSSDAKSVVLASRARKLFHN